MPIVSDSVQRGIPRVEGTEATVLDVYQLARENGESPEGVAETLGITLAEVYEALAYFYNHPDEMHEARDIKEQMGEELAERTMSPPEKD